MYANNILPTEAAYYTLTNATIKDGVMSLQIGGTAVYEITDKVISSLTKYFRLSVVPTSSIDFYKPSLYVYVRAVTKSNEIRNVTLTPTVEANKVYTQEFTMDDGEFTSFTFTVHAEKAVSLQLWELCPEASDEDVEVIIDGVKQSLPRLLYDYNTLPLTVGQNETTVGLITFTLRDATDLQGHLEIAYTASEDGVLTLRAYDTYTEELYTPIRYDIKKGRGNLALPHAYIHRLKGDHSTSITAMVSTGLLTIETRGLLYTIDGGYLAERELDAGVEVLDLSIQRLDGYDKPTAVWLIGIDAKECIVRSRDYDADPSVGFKPEYSIGFAKTAALEFNGLYTLRIDRHETQHALITDEEPYVFWVDANDKLQAQVGSDETTRFTIDSGVTAVSACRGYNSIYDPEQDQGLVLLYVKDGEAYYRNYCYVSEGVFRWQGPYKLAIEETVLDARVHRLNDYRLCFTITTEENNYWYITERTYVSQAFPIETLYVGTFSLATITSMLPANYEYSVLAEAAFNDEHTVITVAFNYPVRLVNIRGMETLTHNLGYLVEEYSTEDDKLYIKLSEPFFGSVTLDYAEFGNLFQVMPWPNSWLPMPSWYTRIVPTTATTDTISISYTGTAVCSVRGIETMPHAYEDTLEVRYDAEATCEALPIITTEYSAPTETISVDYASTEATYVLTQTGVKPI